MFFDSFIFSQLNSLVLKWLWLDCVIVFIAVYVPWILAGVLFLFLLYDFRKHSEPIFTAFLSAVLGSGLVFVINSLIYRQRPHARYLVNYFQQSSFPSLHTTFFFAISVFFILYGLSSERKLWKNLGILFLAISFLIGVSRVFCGVHWPTDILAGIALGSLCGWLVYTIFSHRT